MIVGLPELILRLMLATFLGSIIGIEREVKHHSAGLRTHTLVCVATCLMVVTAIPYANDFDSIARVITGILTGIGFIGAGTIMREQERVLGLTTAAGIFFVAGIGIVCGLGQYLLAIIGALLCLFILRIKGLEFRLAQKKDHA
jgi:putative Mg2+ transporter-C (MgtC) family protein